MATRLVTIFGGSGFVGRHIVRELAARGDRMRIAGRDPDAALFLKPMGDVGQITPVCAPVGDEVRVRRVEYVPVWVRPGDYVVLPATPDADPGNAEALRASFERTTAVAGKGKGVKVANFSAP